MSLIRIILALLCIVVVCSACPNGNFVSKHVCTTCGNNAADATNFAIQSAAWRRRHNRPPSGRNSVFITSTMTYTRQGNLCIFNRRAPKYSCVFRSRRWTCRFSRNVIARHDSRNGHYYYRQDT